MLSTKEDIAPMGEDDARAHAEERLQSFGHNLARQRDEWIRERYSLGVDKRFLEDEDAYNSKDNINKAASQMMTAVEQGYPVTTQLAKPHRSTVYIGLTRMKTNSAEARLADILLPVDDRNWSIQPTPKPELVDLSQDERVAIDPQTRQPPIDQKTGQPLRIKDVVRGKQEEARKKSEAMQREIDDQLTECDYNGELRKVIHDSAVLGTGVLKGPVVMNRTRRAWLPITDAAGQSVQQVQIVEELKPASFRVDVRNVWPDPACGEDVHAGKGLYERQQLTKKQVRDLVKQPGYMKGQLRKVLEEGPKRSATLTELREEDQRDSTLEQFEMWEYWGEVDYEDLCACGVDAGEKDELQSLSACVVMINNTVVKAFINPLEDGALPYDFFVWEKVAGSCWGYGLPYLMMSQQRVMNAAWRQLMDNAGVSSGPQIIVKPGSITPADKQWQLSARKIWYATDDVEDVRTAFTAVEFNSHQAELAGIIKMAQELADAETGVQQLMDGEKSPGPQTLGEAVLRANAANVVLRRLVKQFDDMITRPHIRRYYDYNMMYGEDEEIKGDFQIDARGSSALIVRDIQNQGYMNLLAAGANPLYGKYLDLQKLFEKSLQAQYITPQDVFKSPEEIEKILEAEKQAEGQPPPLDPRVQAAQINAQTAMQEAQAQAQIDAGELRTRMQIAQFEQQARLAELQMQREIEMMKLSAQQNLSLEQIKAQLADTALKERTKKELFTAEQRLKLAVGSGI